LNPTKEQNKTPQEEPSPPQTEPSQFNFEVSSTEGVKDLTVAPLEAPEKEEEGTTTVEAEEKGNEKEIPQAKQQKKPTIKILAERNLPIKEQAPPNYSPYFICFLHYKNQPYKTGRLLPTKNETDGE